MATRLELSQNRLSEIERGGGSFTAEQFLEILRIFNVTTDHFAPAAPDPEDALQNALARLGATHLVEREDVLPSERLREAESVIREVLIAPDWPRQITALAPVLIKNIDDVPLNKLALTLSELGLLHRLGWIAESTFQAIKADLPNADRALQRRYKRAEVVLGPFVERTRAAWNSNSERRSPDFLDKTIRSVKSRIEAQNSGARLARSWGIASSIDTSDFVEALRGARVAGN